MVDLEVAGDEDRACACAHADRKSIRNRVRDLHELELEWAKLEAIATFDDVHVTGGKTMLAQFRFNEGESQVAAVDWNVVAQLREVGPRRCGLRDRV